MKNNAWQKHIGSGHKETWSEETIDLDLATLELQAVLQRLTLTGRMLIGGTSRAHNGWITTSLGVRAIRIGRFGKPLKGLEQSK
jgi:hypothetical protein